MAFDIQFYKNSAESNRVDKTNYLTNDIKITGVMREDSSIIAMRVLIELDAVPTFNYAYIDAFKRYYYVTDIVSVSHKLWSISLYVDVLMTYKPGILNCYGFIDRNEFTYNSNIIDSRIVLEQGYDIEQAQVSNTVFGNKHSFVITGFALGTTSGG